MKLEKGRPSYISDREKREIAVYDMLDRLDIEYERVDHEAAMTMEACVAVDEALGVAMCKNLFLCNRQKTDFYLLLMPGDKPFKTKEISGQIGSARLSFASAEDMGKYLGVMPGSVSVMGLMNDEERDVRLLIDKDLKDCEFFGCHPCMNTSSIKIKTADLFDIILPKLGYTPTYVTLKGED
ncbi:MAG: prolyl-tRNA synthetase associated domain-containing protein [Ruminococcaceae bacterium]|nr:prolyl-tRNA synthetase associated domain-containing protein [Oscillospiraceae bacterium]